MLAVADHVETDGGPQAIGRERFCAVTRRVRPVEELIRFVAGPSGVVPDLKRKLPGRGLWVTARRDVVAEAIRRGVFSRGLRQAVKVPVDLPDLVDRLLVQASLDALAIVHKAGLVRVGFAQVEAAIAGDPVAALLHAKEASADGIRKLAAALRRHARAAEKVPIVRTFQTAQLDLALGRPNVIHAALLAGRASDTFVARWQNLERFRMTGDDRAGEKIAGEGEDAAQPEAGRELGLE